MSLVAIVGCPNVGKLTLSNRLVDEHIAIIERRPALHLARILRAVAGDEEKGKAVIQSIRIFLLNRISRDEAPFLHHC